MPDAVSSCIWPLLKQCACPGRAGIVPELIHAEYYLWRRGDGHLFTDLLPGLPAPRGPAERLQGVHPSAGWLGVHVSQLRLRVLRGAYYYLHCMLLCPYPVHVHTGEVLVCMPDFTAAISSDLFSNSG